MKRILLSLLAIFSIIFQSVQAEEYLHPAGYNILSSYSVSDSIITFGDTILITRSMTNNESFNLYGIFLSDHLPADFNIINQTVEINGTQVDYIFSGAQENLIYSNYSTYHWTLDSPIEGESVNSLLGPGESLTIRYWVVSTNIGNYTLPPHTASFVAFGNGYFVTSDSSEVRVVISSGIEDDPEIEDLLPNYIISTAYPNPFNAEVRVRYEGKGIGGQKMEFEIYNILGQKVHSEKIARSFNNGEFYWQSNADDGSGVYFYKIITENASTRGKLVLVK